MQCRRAILTSEIFSIIAWVTTGESVIVTPPDPRLDLIVATVSEVTPETENTYNIETSYQKRDYKYYMEPRIIVDYTTDIGSERESGSKRDYISSREVFGHISLGGRLPRDLMKILDNNISDKILNSFNGTEDELKEFTTFYWKKEATSSRYNINFVASPYDARMFLTRNYDIILGECTKAFLKYNDQVIY